MTTAAVREIDPFFGAMLKRSLGLVAPEGWEEWLRKLFPKYVTAPFAERHIKFWDWVWAIEADSSPDPEIAIWPRGGAKTTSAELAVTALGTRGKRKYVLYVRATQEKADQSVGNIASMLEARSIEQHYPLHAERAVGKFGNPKGWRRQQLRTAGGFTVDALGLDTAARGAKVDEQRPDLIVLDDIDDKLDSPTTTAKKTALITTSILPAGANNAATLAIQNLIIPDGFFTKMSDGRADYLARRHVSGPHPAVQGLETEWRTDERTRTRRAMIVKGTATWEGQNLAICQKQIDDWGLSAFLKEAQHKVKERAEGVALRFEPGRHYADLEHDQIMELVRLRQVFGGVDFGSWRFAFTMWAVDTLGRPFRIAEYFSQREGLEARAKAMDEIWKNFGSPPIRIWGDSANPTDITELNANFKRVGSNLRVLAVAMDNKIRKTSVERINELLDRNALFFVRSVRSDPEGKPWLHNFNAASSGTPIEGSRLMWEIDHWSYPIPQEGKAQDQDPDDHTADGADMVASMRYAIMSWWRPGKRQDEEEIRPFDPAVLQANADRSRTLKHRMERRKKVGKGGIDTGGY